MPGFCRTFDLALGKQLRCPLKTPQCRLLPTTGPRTRQDLCVFPPVVKLCSALVIM